MKLLGFNDFIGCCFFVFFLLLPQLYSLQINELIWQLEMQSNISQPTQLHQTWMQKQRWPDTYLWYSSSERIPWQTAKRMCLIGTGNWDLLLNWIGMIWRWAIWRSSDLSMSATSLAVGKGKIINSLALLCMDRVVGWWSEALGKHPVREIKLQEVQQIRNSYLLFIPRNFELLWIIRYEAAACRLELHLFAFSKSGISVPWLPIRQEWWEIPTLGNIRDSSWCV